jgi:Ca2+-transporting ATPase
MTLDEVRRVLAANIEVGLTHEHVRDRQKLYGPNQLEESDRDTVFDKVLRQFKSPLVFVLLIAGLVTLLLQHFVDAIVIGIALLINLVVGTLQEERASKAFEKLNESQDQRAIVVREGKKANIPVAEVVPGDLIILEAGYYVPADARIFEEKELSINEASLTGEWLPVNKDVETFDHDVPLAEQRNMAWMGTLIESGMGKAIVVATGQKTQIGAIANELASIEEQLTPLQKNIRSVARFLTYVIAFAIGIIFVLGITRGEPVGDMLLIAIAVAVATIPSGLPAAVTVVLAIGMEAILKKGGLVRNLLAAETLGATTVILTDKTGTLTEAKMKLGGLYTWQSISKQALYYTEDDHFLLENAVRASDAFVEEQEDAPSKLTVHGRAIEKAVVIAGLEYGLSQEELSKTHPRTDYLQFESSRRYCVALIDMPRRKTRRAIFTGAPETLLACATHLYKDGKRAPLNDRDRAALAEVQLAKSSEGVRLIGAAFKEVDWEEIPDEHDPENPPLIEKTTFIGFLGFEDPLREDVPEAIQRVKGAGADVIMITGDNPETAGAIARKVGIIIEGDELVVRGDELEQYSDDELYEKLQEIRVIARALPVHKLRIARVLKGKGEVVAMTGDGVNDAPALRAANIGLAVGSGTEVAKESSDMVLINNSFAIIVSAIEEGRRIIDNLKKIIAYLLSTSFSEIIIIGSSLVAGVPLPLLPSQILWANIVEEGLMSFSFAFEGADPNAMKRDPRSAAAKNIMTQDLQKLIFIVSAVTGVLLVALYFWLLSIELPIEEIRTIIFVALSLDAIFFTFSLKSFDVPVWKINLWNNRYLLFALGSAILTLVIALVFPPLQKLLSLTSLTGAEILLLLGLGLINLFTIEIAKYFLFERKVADVTD